MSIVYSMFTESAHFYFIVANEIIETYYLLIDAYYSKMISILIFSTW